MSGITADEGPGRRHVPSGSHPLLSILPILPKQFAVAVAVRKSLRRRPDASLVLVT